MTAEIRVPKFEVKAGPAMVTVEKVNDWSDLWTFTIPNDYRLPEELRLHVHTFDQARAIAERLADLVEAAHDCWQLDRDHYAAELESVADDAAVQHREDRP